MNIHDQQHGAVTVLKPDGPISQDGANVFKQRLFTALDQSLGRVVVDLSAVPFVDSLALEVFADANAELSAGGQVLRFCNINETLREVFDLTGMGSHFEQFDEVNSAVRSFL